MLDIDKIEDIPKVKPDTEDIPAKLETKTDSEIALDPDIPPSETDLDDKTEITFNAETNDTSPPLWAHWDDYEKIEKNGQEYAVIGDRCYTKHAVERMYPSGNRYRAKGPGDPAVIMISDSDQLFERDGVDNTNHSGRGVPPQYVDDVIANSEGIPQNNGNIRHELGSLEVIVDSEGDVISVMTKDKVIDPQKEEITLD